MAGPRQKSLIDLREAEIGDMLRALTNAHLAGQRRELMNILPDMVASFQQEVLETSRIPSRDTINKMVQEAFDLAVNAK